MLTVGIMGGMGPAATVDFLRRVVEATPAEQDQDHIPILLDCDPRVPDRTAAIAAEATDDDVRSPVRHLAQMARRLEECGAHLLVMPCNSAHFYYDKITADLTIPLVDWPLETAKVAKAQLGERVGLLAIEGTVRGKVYDRAFEAAGIELVLPAPEGQRAASLAIDIVKGIGPADPGALEALREAARSVFELGATGVLLACTELSAIAGLYSDDDLDLALDWLDPAQIIAEHVVTEALKAPASATTP